MKKRISALILCICFAAAASGCGNTEDTDNRERNVQEERTGAGEDSGTAADESTADTSELQENAPQTSGNILVAYFSWADNAILADDVDAVASPSVIPPGNVQQLAGWVQEETGGDLFPIQVTEPYSSDWDECLDRANQEKAEGTRPELVETVENMDDYDVIFLGYPNWWYSCPMALISFLEEYDFSGKQVYLFCSHGTGGLANSVEDITEVIPDADLSDNVFDVYEEDASSSRDEVESWLQELEY